MSTFTTNPTYRRCQAMFDRCYPGFYDAGLRYRDTLKTLIGPQTAVLEIGCGQDSLAAATMHAAGSVAGIDLDWSALSHNRVVTWPAAAHAGRLPFSSDRFDLVVSQWVVEHLSDPQVVFAEMARVLRPGGRIVLLTTNAHNYVSLLSRLIHERVQEWLIERCLQRPAHESFPTFYRANTRTALSRLASLAGLRLEACTFVGNPFYLAFYPPLFRLALLFEQVTDLPAMRSFKLYLLATLRKSPAVE